MDTELVCHQCPRKGMFFKVAGEKLAALRPGKAVVAMLQLIKNAVRFPQLSVRRRRKCSANLPAHLA